ncbi:MAG: DUF460 domain-containing protein [Nanoarchaeota archaeon]|nr:DUF460 domain-containing protein [Nanoarchaeota archaeon]
MKPKRLVVGIDPGTTTGYAVFDLDGNVIAIDSSKELNLGLLISKIISYGKPLLVGTDKKNVPEFVHKFAAKTGAKLVFPKEDLLSADKIRETKPFIDKFSNSHEIDAIASALVCFSYYKDLFAKIDFFVEKYKKEQIKDDIKEIVIKKGLSIRTALEIIEKPEDESVKIIKKAVEKRIFNENDFLTMFGKLKKTEYELNILKKQNQNLMTNDAEARKRIGKLSERLTNTITDEKAKATIKLKERRELMLYDSIEKLKKQYEKSKEDNERLNYMIGGVGHRILLKKLENLSWNGFSEKNNTLRIEKGDILLVENPNIIGDKLIEFIRNKIQIIITKAQVSDKISHELEFTFIDGSKLDIEEAENFATINQKDLEEARRKIDILHKIVMDYRRQRQNPKEKKQ